MHLKKAGRRAGRQAWRQAGRQGGRHAGKLFARFVRSVRSGRQAGSTEADMLGVHSARFGGQASRQASRQIARKRNR